MIDLQAEELLTLPQAAKTLPRTPAIGTLYRWISRGSRGVKLEAARVGGILYVSRESIQRFSDRLTNPSATPSRSTPKSRQRAVEKAEAELSAAGI